MEITVMFQIIGNSLFIKLRNQCPDGAFLTRTECRSNLLIGKTSASQWLDGFSESGNAKRESIAYGSVKVENNSLQHLDPASFGI